MGARDTLASVSDAEPTTVAPSAPVTPVMPPALGDADETARVLIDPAADEPTVTKTIVQAVPPDMVVPPPVAPSVKARLAVPPVFASTQISRGSDDKKQQPPMSPKVKPTPSVRTESEDEDDEQTGTETGTIPGVPARLISTVDPTPRLEHTERLQLSVSGSLPIRYAEGTDGAPDQGPDEPVGIAGLDRSAWPRSAALGAGGVLAIALAVHLLTPSPAPRTATGATATTARSASVVASAPPAPTSTPAASPTSLASRAEPPPVSTAGPARTSSTGSYANDDPLGEQPPQPPRPSPPPPPPRAWTPRVPTPAPGRAPSSGTAARPSGTTRGGIVRDAPF